jgi:hypothetical protein
MVLHKWVEVLKEQWANSGFDHEEDIKARAELEILRYLIDLGYSEYKELFEDEPGKGE